jgi:hypothetical protein
MMGILLLCAAVAASIEHTTPPDRTTIGIVVLPDRPTFKSVHLSRGTLVHLSYLQSGGVLALLTYNNYAVYFGFSDGNVTRWFAPPGDVRGFFVFGDAPETEVEIVAIDDTDVVFTGTFVGDCGVIRAGLLTTHSGGRSCFLSTDVMSAVRVFGRANGSSIRISTPTGTAVYNSKEGLMEVRPFNIVSIDDDENVSVVFQGGNVDYRFDNVISATPRGIVGRGRRWDFNELTQDIVYPKANVANPLLAIIAITVSLVMIAITCTWISCRAVHRKGASGNESRSNQLFDQRPDPSDGMTSEEKTSESDNESNKPMEYTSPYETL